MFPELANEELPSDMDENKLLLQGGDTTLESEESDDEDFNPLEEEEEEKEDDDDDDDDDGHQHLEGEGKQLDDGENGSCNEIGKYRHVLFFHPDEMERNNFRNGEQHGRQENSDVIKGGRGMQRSIREGVETSERNGGGVVEQSVGVEGQNNDLQKGLSKLFEVEAASDSDSDSDSDSSMIVDTSEAAREMDELSDGFSEEDPARHNRKRCRLASSKVDDSKNELKNFTLSGVS